MTRKSPPRKRPAPKPPIVQVSDEPAFFIATPMLSWADRLRLLVHGRMIVAGEINRTTVTLSEITIAIPTIEGVITHRPRSFAFANYMVKPA